jgi:hypothetical protein
MTVSVVVGTFRAARSRPRVGGGLLDGGVEFGERVGAGTGPRRHLLRQLLGEPVQFGDGAGVRDMRLQSAALAGERGPSYGGDVVEVRAEGGGGLSVSARSSSTCRSTRALRRLGGALGLGAPGGDVRGDLVPLVGEGVGQRQRVLGLPGERHQVLGVAQFARGGDQDGAPAAAMAAATTATATMSRLRTWVRRPLPAGSGAAVHRWRPPEGPSACLCAEAAFSAPVLAFLTRDTHGPG